MKILIVGGAGYLGGAITDLLIQSKHNILVYDILLYEETYRKQIPFVYGDIRDREKLKKYLNWADVIIWLAALVGDPACALNEELTIEINKNSVQFLKDNFKGRIIYISTCSLYGAGENILDEKSSLNPFSLYAKTKFWSEEILNDANVLIFRLGTLYGISDNFSRIRFDLVVNTLVMRAAIHKKIGVFGGKQYRPLLHVREAASAICSAIDTTNNKGIYNLHSENVTIIEIANRIKKYFPMLQVEIDKIMFQDKRDYRVSSDKAKRELGFNPILTIDEGIKELKELLEEGRIKNSFITRFSNYLYLKPLLDEYSSPLGKLVKLNI
jgi:nucleoside-diphosphate-sugar epimerase